MAFSEKVKRDAMIACGRSCCICHKFCGSKMEVHHIIAQYEGGNDDFENAIPLCFDCHADVKSYNPNHPKGNKYDPMELRGHRDKWYKLQSQNKTQEQEPQPFKRIIPQSHKDLMLIRVTSGNQLMSFIADKYATSFSYEEPKSREEAKIIGDFTQYITELVDIESMLEPSDKVKMGYELNETISDLEKEGFWVFVNEEMQKLTGGIINTPENFPVLYVRIVRKNSKEIIHVSKVKEK